MKNLKLNVKDGSVLSFLKENLTNQLDLDRNDCNPSSPYHSMRDELLFVKDLNIKVGESISIELFDIARGSGRELVNTYIYQAEEYDDVSIKMVLKDFKVTNK